MKYLILVILLLLPGNVFGKRKNIGFGSIVEFRNRQEHMCTNKYIVNAQRLGHMILENKKYRILYKSFYKTTRKDNFRIRITKAGYQTAKTAKQIFDKMRAKQKISKLLNLELKLNLLRLTIIALQQCQKEAYLKKRMRL